MPSSLLVAIEDGKASPLGEPALLELIAGRQLARSLITDEWGRNWWVAKWTMREQRKRVRLDQEISPETRARFLVKADTGRPLVGASEMKGEKISPEITVRVEDHGQRWCPVAVGNVKAILSRERRLFLLESLSVCLGGDVGKVSKRKDIFPLICKVSESEHTIDWMSFNLPIEELSKYWNELTSHPRRRFGYW